MALTFPCSSPLNTTTCSGNNSIDHHKRILKDEKKKADWLENSVLKEFGFSFLSPIYFRWGSREGCSPEHPMSTEEKQKKTRKS